MRSPAPAPPVTESTVSPWSRRVLFANRLFLPFAAAGCLALVALLALGLPGPIRVYSILALGVVGVGTLASSLSLAPVLAALPVAAASAARSVPSTPRAEALAPPRPLVRRPDLNHRFLPLHSTVHTGAVHSGGPVATVVASPGDELWTEWAHAGPGRLPVELVGPVPETAYAPPPRGGMVPFPDKEPQMVVTKARPAASAWRLRPLPSASTASGTPTTLSVASPTRRLLRDAPVRAAPRRPEPSVSVSGALDAEGSVALLGTHWLWAEALNPMPPHLRDDSLEAVAPPAPAAAPPKAPVPVAKKCPECTTDLPTGPSVQRCPSCHEPVCLVCSVRAAVSYGDEWCQNCGLVRGPKRARDEDPYDGLVPSLRAQLSPDLLTPASTPLALHRIPASRKVRA